MAPLVAIICTVYNHEKYISRCLDGFVMQKTNYPFIAIIHDDASSDSSAKIINSYKEKYPEIILPIIQKENQYSKGISAINGIIKDTVSNAGAKYIAFCEGDDYWTDPLKLEKQVQFMESNPEVGLCYTDYDVFEEDSGQLRYARFQNKMNIPSLSFEEHLFHQAYIAPMTWVAKTELYFNLHKQISPTFKDGSYALALEFFANSKVEYLPFVSATYNNHPNSASHNADLFKTFNYRLSVYEIQRYYAQKYISNEWITFLLKRIEIAELLPLAIRLNKSDYINDCKAFAKEHRVIIGQYYKQAVFEKIASILDSFRIIAPIKKIFSKSQTRLLE